MGKAPAFQFYVKDWLSDTELQLCNCSTRGIWINLLCHMWYAQERGRLEVTIFEIMTLAGATEKESNAFVTQAKSKKFCDISVTANGNVTLINRRMWKYDKSLKLSALRQKKYRAKGVRKVSDGKVTGGSSSSTTVKRKPLSYNGKVTRPDEPPKYKDAADVLRKKGLPTS